MDEPETEPGQWLNLAGLAARTGRHIDAVRSWAKRGQRGGRIRTRKSNRGEIHVWVTPELAAELELGRGSVGSLAATQPPAEPEAQATQAEAQPMTQPSGLDGLAGLVADMRGQMDRAGAALAEAREEAAEARGELAAEVRRGADLAEALRHERSRADVERARADRLETELARARRPLLLRLVEALRRRD